MFIVRFAEHLKRSLRDFRELPLMLRIGLFVLSVPRELGRIDLTDFLHTLRGAQRVNVGRSTAGFEQVARLRQFWLSLPVLRWRNTCYVRALTLYRFLDCGKGDLRIHFGVEPGVRPYDRLRGHAWVTFDGHVLEERAVLERPVREIYVHPHA
jgi:hypothetical protein